MFHGEHLAIVWVGKALSGDCSLPCEMTDDNMAVLIHMDKVITMAVLHSPNNAMPSFPSPRQRGKRAEALIAQIFNNDGWEVQRGPLIGSREADMVISKGDKVFVVEIKALSEGRADRVIPMLSQAILQAQALARIRAERKVLPLAIIYVENASPSLFNQVSSFSKKFAPDVAVGIIAESGPKRFLGHGLEGLDAEPKNVYWGIVPSSNQGANIFSDLNQWMLKVLLAVEIPEHLLAAPRREYRNASELANASQVSIMSAFRFVQQLQKEGFLESLSGRLLLVRRAELFRRWQVAALRQSPELPMRFLIRGSLKAQIREFVSNHHACLGLFAAADEFQLGHVLGVPPYIYVPKLPSHDSNIWKELVHKASSEAPDLILRQSASPKSVFRGAVHRDGMAISDIVQVWLDVSAHPSRGEEQAAVIYRKVLQKIIERVA
jgi:hypothetical protein